MFSGKGIRIMYQKRQLPIDFILKSIQPFRLLIALEIFIAVFNAVWVSLRPYLLKILLDGAALATVNHTVTMLSNAIILFLGFYAALIISYRVHDWFVPECMTRIKQRIALLISDQMMEHSMLYYHQNHVGSLTTKINEVINGIPLIIQKCIDLFLHNFVAFICAIICAGLLNSKFAIGLAVWIALSLLLSMISLKKAKAIAHTMAMTRVAATDTIADILTNMSSIQLFTTKNHEIDHLKNYVEKAYDTEQHANRFFFILNILQSGCFMLFQTLCLWWLFNDLQEGEVTVGDFALIITLNVAIIERLWLIADEVRRVTQTVGVVNQALSVLMPNFSIHNQAPLNRALLHVTEGTIAFNNVQFNYAGVPPIFEKKSVVIEAGQKVGLVGYSGSGKSTFINLILRMFTLQSGSITIDCQDIHQVTQESVRAAIALIPQDPLLFCRTIRENIRYGNLDATDQQVMDAAIHADAHEFICKLPQGYETAIGQEGIRLSGGQRQRIAIARAFLKDARILILDEATSQLDAITEAHIQKSLQRLMVGKTTLIIAHRLSTLLHMDRILVFECGKIVQDGTHEELVAKKGLYNQLWNSQMGGILKDR
jgi:ATP-binding cassette subfamily B protein